MEIHSNQFYQFIIKPELMEIDKKMVKARKLSGTENTRLIIMIIFYMIGFFIALTVFLFILEYSGFLTELRLRFEEMLNI